MSRRSLLRAGGAALATLPFAGCFQEKQAPVGRETATGMLRAQPLKERLIETLVQRGFINEDAAKALEKKNDAEVLITDRALRTVRERVDEAISEPRVAKVIADLAKQDKKRLSKQVLEIIESREFAAYKEGDASAASLAADIDAMDQVQVRYQEIKAETFDYAQEDGIIDQESRASLEKELNPGEVYLTRFVWGGEKSPEDAQAALAEVQHRNKWLYRHYSMSGAALSLGIEQSNQFRKQFTLPSMVQGIPNNEALDALQAKLDSHDLRLKD